ncbi:PilN domain-containing protein [Luteimonas sp. RC10]|jgi:type IV pilus assembly protein PilN|uniref:PilN domain-containing protein n=1 Tax=Luteimonas sp. RC10 TaxID=2587035 RepID=UPI00160A4F43|nr:PilN domain-containing protein [Luteimonas sp. RC10]MBB3345135.1 type IV pilus assembly protein PilN [Luteimonas sp. RC10]
MARINLLPWRAERRRQRQKEFGIMAALAAVAGIVLWLLVNMYYNAQLDGQHARNAFLQQQIAELDREIVEIDSLDRQRARLLARKAVIEELQGNRSQMVHLFDQLVRTIPDGVLLTSLKQEGQMLTLEGRSQSNARVSTYMRALEGSGWMTNPQLAVIEARDGVPGLPYAFTLNVQLSTPAAKEAGATTPAPAAPAQEVAP